MYLMKHVCADDLLPLNKVMVFTVLEVSRQAILLSVVVVSAHRIQLCVMCWEAVVIVEVWPPGCYVDVVDSCVDCVNANVRQYTDRNKVLHQYMYMYVVMVMV